jgi:hypothetical protein
METLKKELRNVVELIEKNKIKLSLVVVIYLAYRWLMNENDGE